ncbi:hypothetical protein [Streptomyces sp. NPDC058755]|uniref:hypothetical protein n=1 Tax=Streptomyces sp. NPDC058755 TaxID=3346624 RepID=UPI0036937F11
MTAALLEPLALGTRVGIIDDDPLDAITSEQQVRLLRWSPVRVSLDGAPSVDDAITRIQQLECSALLCDHRLHAGYQVDFSGAELACRANSLGLPAVVLTTFAATDQATTIRRWRHGVPCVLDKSTASTPDVIGSAFAATNAELLGRQPRSRIGYRTVVRVVGVRLDANYPTAEVIVTAWRPSTAVIIPLALLPLDGSQEPEDLVGRRFMGKVNYYAQEADELFFADLEPATPVPANWMR